MGSPVAAVHLHLCQRLNIKLKISSRRRQTSTWCRHLMNMTKHMHHLSFCPFVILCENMMSSTKLKAHNVLHSHDRRSKPWQWPHITCTENLEVWFFICKQTDRHTDIDRQKCFTILCTSTRDKVITADDSNTEDRFELLQTAYKKFLTYNQQQ